MLNFRRTVLSMALVAAALGGAPSSASAAPADSPPPCSDQVLSQPFVPWADPASYTPQPGGGFETSLTGWTLSGGAGVVAGNEPYMVAGTDHRSLALPAGSQVLTSSVCVSLAHSTVRFFARRTDGAADGTLAVDVVVPDADGVPRDVPVGVVAASGAWTPSAPLPVVVNLFATLPEGLTAVRFRFTPVGDAAWQLDDVFIDPWHSR